MPLNTVMYHYVRDNEEYEYDTFGRRVEEFYRQIEFFNRNSSIIDPNDIEKVTFYLTNDYESAYLLTFDDGYIDHFNCAKFLHANNHSAFFFPPKAIFEDKILPVNLIHLILGNRYLNSDKILEKIMVYVKEKEIKITLKEENISINDYLINCELNPLLFDDRINLLIKRLLQRDIKIYSERINLINYLFKDIYKKSPKDYIRNFYISQNNIKEMKKMGMCFGSHGVSHIWMSESNQIIQEEEINNSYLFLENELNVSSNKFRVFCYPYGDYNKQTLKSLLKSEVKFGFTTVMGKSSIKPSKQYSELLLKRWDTNNYWNNSLSKPCINHNLK